ncbi:MAG: NAD(P)-binding domain-containing protein, partial [Bryobacteraceae bacterium]
MTRYDIGIVGLGVMGQNLALNMASKGFSVAGFDLDPDKNRAAAAKFAGRRMTT